MEKKSISWSSILLIIVLLLTMYGILERYLSKPTEVIQVRVDTAYVRDTITETIRYDRLSKETIVVDTSRVNYDSLIAQAFEEWKTSLKDTVEKVFVVKADTTLPDSLVSISTAFYSPLPIHPKSYMTWNISTKIPVVTKTITIERETITTPLLTYGLTVGLGYGFISQKPDVYVGAGIFLNVGKLL